jgi:preprotein translocase subunit Sss1
VTGFAIIGGIGMVARFALRYRSIVTTETGANHFTMIQWCYEWQPAVWRHPMAGIAIVGGIGMITRLTLGDTVVVTAGAGANNLAVVNVTGLHRRPRCRTWLMTGITKVRTVNMITRLSASGCSIMATGTATRHLVMINRRCRNRRPVGRKFAMAGITYVSTVYVRSIFATCGNAIMTAKTITGKRRVIHHCYRRPRVDTMTGIAIQRRRYMTSRFTRRNGIIVTAGTRAKHFVMINSTRGNRRPRRRCRLMTGLAHVSGINMVC